MLSAFYDVNSNQIVVTNKYNRVWFEEPEPSGIAIGKINPIYDKSMKIVFGRKTMNNKLIKNMLLITAISFTITSCSTKKAASQSETAEIIIDFSFVDESDYDLSSVHLFIPNENYLKLMFTTNVPVKDFRWLSIGPVWDENDDIGFEVADVLYSITEFLPQKPLVVSWIEVGIFPSSGISYLDEKGQRKYFMLMSNDYGGDPEEEGYNGGISLSEFTPVGDFFLSQPEIIGQYRNTEDVDGGFILDLAENSYTLKVNGASYTGAYEFTYSYETWWVSLPNIKWAHNWIENYTHGNLDNIDPDNMIDEETYGVELWLENGNELVFQNHGNPMAPYVIFEIGDKWVRLIKR